MLRAHDKDMRMEGATAGSKILEPPPLLPDPCLSLPALPPLLRLACQPSSRTLFLPY